MDEVSNPQAVSLKSRFTKKDLAALRRLRNYYKREFENGDSDECFLLWMEDGVRVIATDKQKAKAEG